MPDVLIGQSYYLRFDPKLQAAMQPYPPLGSLYAAAVLRQDGHTVALFDAMLAGGEQEWAEALDRHPPRVAVLFEDNFNYLSKMCLGRMREAALTMIGAARKRAARVVVCGSDASDQPEAFLEAGADFVILGEGEATLVELMAHLAGRGASGAGAIPGLAYRDGGRVVRTPARPVMRQLDALPRPAWDLVDAERYRAAWKRHGRYSVNMVTTRGCPYHCNWCAKPIWGQTYNSRSPEAVAVELSHLKGTLRPDHVWFADDILGLVPGWLARFADAVEKARVRTPFQCQSRVDLLLRPGEIEALARAGCETVWVGAESGSQKVLDAMEKGTRVEQIRSAAAALHDRGVRVGFFLQFGYPGESREDIEKTLALVREARPDEIGVSVSYPLPGTPFYERVRDQLGEKRHWNDSSDLAMMYRGPFTTEFYRILYSVVQKDFRWRRAWRELGAALRRPRTLTVRHLRRVAAASIRAGTLPFERRRLERAARTPHDPVAPLPTKLSPEESARPTPQS